MQDINWNIGREDSALVHKILDRAVKAGHLRPRNRLNTEMDIIACHLNGMPLRLADWLAADDFNFEHDLYGIDRHIDRTTGKLTGCFVPRFAKPQPKRHTLMGRSFAVVAEFPDTDEGTREANAFMEANPGAAVLEVTDGRVILADKADMGVDA